MKVRGWIAWLLILAFAACGPYWTSTASTYDHPGRITVCLNLPPSQLPEAHVAVTQWDNVLFRWNRIEAVDNPADQGNCSIIVHTTHDVYVGFDGKSEENALAWCSCVGCREISMRVGSYERDVSGILQHEIGHALGAQHAVGTLMDPVWHYGSYSCPDRTTVLQVAAWNRIDASTLSWCFY